MARKNEDGKLIIGVALFHGTVSVLWNATLSFNVLDGISLEQTKKITAILNENMLDISVNNGELDL